MKVSCFLSILRKKLQQFKSKIGLFKKSLGIIEKPVFKLKNYSLIEKKCENAMRNSEFLIVSGESGSGKTESLLGFSKIDCQLIKYIRLSKSMTSSIILTEIGKSFSLEFTYKNKRHFMNWIRDYIIVSNKKQLLIIDEAGLLSKDQIGIILQLKGLTEGKLGIVLSGPEYLIENLNAWYNIHEKENSDSLRISNYILWLENLAEEEVILVCESFKITSNQIIKENFMSIKNIGDLLNSIENYILSRKNKAFKIDDKFY